MSGLLGADISDRIDVALAELELYAADAWSNLAIVERVKSTRGMRAVERVRSDIWQPPQQPDEAVEAPLVITPDTRWP